MILNIFCLVRNYNSYPLLQVEVPKKGGKKKAENNEDGGPVRLFVFCDYAPVTFILGHISSLNKIMLFLLLYKKFASCIL